MPTNCFFRTIYRQDIGILTEFFTEKENQDLTLSEKIELFNSNDDAPYVLRYGINTYNTKHIVGQYIQEGLMHPYEKVLFQPSGFINIGNGQTHMILLWKESDYIVRLIDPSKKSFSDHLIGEMEKLTDDIKIKSVAQYLIYGTSNHTTEYSKYDEVKPKARDCIDIAVKIAFELNEQQAMQESSPLERAIKQISNDKKLAKHLECLIQGTLAPRELQSSNYETRKSSREAMELLQQHKKLVTNCTNINGAKIKIDNFEKANFVSNMVRGLLRYSLKH